MKTLLLLLALIAGSISIAQKSAIGFIIDFKENCSFDEQKQLLDKYSWFKNLEAEHALSGFDVSLALFENPSNSIDLNEVQSTLESEESIRYTSVFYQNENGAVAGDLPQVYIQTKSEWTKNEALAFAGKIGAISFDQYKGISNAWRFQLDKTSSKNLSSLKKTELASGEYNFITQNMLYSLQATTNDPYLANQWALQNDGTALQYNGTIGADMEVVAAWAMNTGENYIKIAVLDSGTDTNHVDLVGNLLPGFDATGSGTKGYPNTTYSNDGHGTCTAGIIAARADNNIGIAGIAYDCKAIPVRIFYYINIGAGPIPFTSSSAGVDGIIWAVDTAKADILSNSWGLRDTDIATLGIDTAMSNNVLTQKIASGRYGKGVPMLFSSGNDGDNYSIWPSSHPKTISVGASTMCDGLKKPTDCSPENWWGSNYGLNLDVTAPGVKVLATDMTGSLGYNGFSDNDYTEFNGTSAACPNAAGVMALILSEDSTLTELQAREILSRTAEQVGGYQYDQAMTFGWWSDEMGYGRVNALKALQYMNSTASVPSENKLDLYYENGLVYLLNTDFNSLQLMDMRGALISEIDSTKQTVCLNDYVRTSGVYLLNCMRGDQKVVQKIIIH